MRVAFSYWGFLEKPSMSNIVETPDGMRGERYLVVDELLSRGHEVFCVQKRREETPYPGVTYADTDIPDVDVAFFEWRWQIGHKNVGESAVENDWTRQTNLLYAYTRRGVPMLAQDSDHKLTLEDEHMWPSLVIGEPSLDPIFNSRHRIKMPWCTDWRQYNEPADYSYNYSYLGNNYERDAMFMKYFGRPSELLRKSGIQTMIYGNWLNRSPERADPATNLRRWPYTSFGGRLSFKDGMEALSKSICTTHIAKESYAEHGFITTRTFEAIQNGLPALIPAEHHYLKSLGLGEFVVDTPESVLKCVEMIQKMNRSTRLSLVARQKEELMKLEDFSPKHKVDLIEAVGRGEIKAEK